MSNFNDGAPHTPKEWIEQNNDIVPCKNKVPAIPGWQKQENYIYNLDDWKKKFPNHQIGLILKDKTDFDIDNHYINRFVGKYLKSCGAMYGRKSNPLSHYLFLGELKSFKYVMPKELESYYKDFPHGSCLCEIRSGSGHQSIVPGSVINNEKVEWYNFAQINSYDGDLEADIGKIALSAALSILYPSKGDRDSYCTAIAGVLSKHTNCNEDDINEFVYNLAVLSDDHEPNKRMAKGTTSKEKTFGMPKLAEIIKCNVKTIADLFSWVGVKDSGSCFTGLKCYTTEPKYWQLEYKGKWITVMESSMLLSYTKMSILILENCYEVAPVVTPKEWKEIVSGLLQSVQKIDAPYESSYYGNIGIEFINYFKTGWASDKTQLVSEFMSGAWLHDNYWYFRLEHYTQRLRRKQLSFEMRKMTHFLREEFGAEPTKITVSKKEVRVWKVPEKNIEEHELNNSDSKGWHELTKKRLDAEKKARADGGIPF